MPPRAAKGRPEPESGRCSLCATAFGLMTRRRVCKKCRQAVCAACSDSRQPVAGYKDPQRVCVQCHHTCLMLEQASDEESSAPATPDPVWPLADLAALTASQLRPGVQCRVVAATQLRPAAGESESYCVVLSVGAHAWLCMYRSGADCTPTRSLQLQRSTTVAAATDSVEVDGFATLQPTECTATALRDCLLAAVGVATPPSAASDVVASVVEEAGLAGRGVDAWLAYHGYDTLPTLQVAQADELRELGLPIGHARAVLRAAAARTPEPAPLPRPASDEHVASACAAEQSTDSQPTAATPEGSQADQSVQRSRSEPEPVPPPPVSASPSEAAVTPPHELAPSPPSGCAGDDAAPSPETPAPPPAADLPAPTHPATDPPAPAHPVTEPPTPARPATEPPQDAVAAPAAEEPPEPLPALPEQTTRLLSLHSRSDWKERARDKGLSFESVKVDWTPLSACRFTTDVRCDLTSCIDFMSQRENVKKFDQLVDSIDVVDTEQQPYGDLMTVLTTVKIPVPMMKPREFLTTRSSCALTAEEARGGGMAVDGAPVRRDGCDGAEAFAISYANTTHSKRPERKSHVRGHVYLTGYLFSRVSDAVTRVALITSADPKNIPPKVLEMGNKRSMDTVAKLKKCLER
eukprot:TRINITY_DN659_c0_g1_i6.p1 TRINITY_DN659_c0_g1~~TRINITY_DN659_c0_g1_i6.p1  ORF type:complete len:663 (+),score=169.37 TRINITY_DN659_c0_g1_i6:87-1991(+)